MKAYTLVAALLLSITVFAQTDSTDIKLAHYKDLFVKGLITAQEYETLKAQTLGISKPTTTQQTTTVIIQQPKPVSKIDSTQAAKYRTKSMGNLVAGGGGIALGTGLIVGGVFYHRHIQYELSSSVDGYNDDKLTKQDRIGTVSLCLFGSIAEILGITAISVGSVQRHRMNKYNRSLSFNISANNLGLAYNF
jgi:hypothetical protein